MQFYVKYVKINIAVIWKSKEIHLKSWRVILQDNIKEENKMAARRTEKQNMLRAYEMEMEEKRRQEEEDALYEAELEETIRKMEEEREQEEQKKAEWLKELMQEEEKRMMEQGLCI